MIDPSKARTVLVTGCSSGIGRHAALLLAARGHRVVATARKPELLADLEREAQEAKLAFCVTACDVESDESMRQAVEFARKKFGPVHILVNNAGYGAIGPLELIPLPEARRQFEVNVFGAVRLVQLVMPDMRAAGWGRIINVSSIAGKMVIPLGGWYSASKFAMEALSDTLRLEMEPFGIHTVSILPGPVKTEFLSNISLSEVPPDMPRRYHALVALVRERQGRRVFEISAAKVARVILRAAESSRPRPRYILTVPARAGAALRPFFTDRAWDRFIRYFYGLHKLD